MPRVTALMPCYNAAEFIGSTLDCLVAQTWPNLEILIGDDCSTDETPQIVARFAQEHPNVRVILRDRNVGWLKNSNDLMSQAGGELMFFAFHDDLVAPDYVEKLAGALQRNRTAVMAFSDMVVTETDGTSQTWSFDVMDGVRSALNRGLVMCTLKPGWWVPNRGLFRAWAFRQIGGIKPNDKGEYSADWPWLLHMSLLGEFVRVPETLCWKFYKKGSLSKTWPYDKERRDALMRAGLAEIRSSRLGPVQKVVLVRYLEHKIAGRSVRPVFLKRFLRRLLRLPDSASGS